MKNVIRTTTRIIAAAVICAALSACAAQQMLPGSASSFPTYGSQAGVSGQAEAPGIMDF